MDNTNIVDILDFISPSDLSYQEWINVGMALKENGYSVTVWDNWSKKDALRYHEHECQHKWNTFNGSSEPITVGTIIQMAKERGWKPYEDSPLDWNSEIGGKGVVIDKNWLEGRDIHIPEQWDPVKQLTTYLETLFNSDENVGYVTESWEKDGRHMPTKGCWDRTAGELIQLLNKCKGDIGAVLGDYNEECGAWIRFNPLDGKGIRNENVTDFRYALVESDNTELETQNAIMRELELPIACMVYSGKKSIHAIVKIDAVDSTEYKKRVNYLYDICKKNGLEIDSQNRNPSRLSRMPGVMRNGTKQYLLDTNIGKASWNEWYEWIEGINDNLPDPEGLSDIWENLPELSPPLIENVLRQGHKMLLAGPSKAGKSFSLVELCCAIAEGRKWLDFNCTQGKVLYVNLEVDRASCLHRFKDVYTALKWEPDNIGNIDIWNLRGNSIPMDKLAPKLIRRALKKNYIAVVIDPIYKIITGDENSAEQMSHFCNQFDKVCNELGCAVIYCHHHSKGSQGDKRSIDRASGSGVFARDPDALIDLIEIELSDSVKAFRRDKEICAICRNWLQRFNKLDEVDEDVLYDANKAQEAARSVLMATSFKHLKEDIAAAEKSLESQTAWRIEGTLREFPKFSPINVWFNYPIHVHDADDILKDLDVTNSKKSNYKLNFSGKKSKEQRAAERRESFEMAFEMCQNDGRAQIKDIAGKLGKTEKTVKGYIDENENFWHENGLCGKN